MDKFKLCKKLTEPTYKTPKSIQQCIGITKIAKNGIFEIKENQLYDRLYRFDDINYNIGDEKSQENIFYSYVKFLNSMGVKFKIILANHSKDMKAFREDILYKHEGNDLDEVRDDYNEFLEEKIQEGRKGIEQRKYINVSTEQRNYEEALQYFNTLENNIRSRFQNMGSELAVLDCNERLQVLHWIYRLGREDEFSFDFDSARKLKQDWKNEICPGMYDINDNYIYTGEKYYRTLFIKKFPVTIEDSLINSIAGVSFNTVTTIDITPIPKDAVNSKLLAAYMNNEKSIINQEKARLNNNQFSTDISYDKRKQKEKIENLMNESNETDSQTFFVGVTIIVAGNDLKELDANTEILKNKVKGSGTVIDVHWIRQHEAFMTTLPVAGTYVKTARTLNSVSLGMLIPFNCATLQQPGGIYYGTNQLDKSLIIADRQKLPAGHGHIFGKTNFGKGMFIKNVITQNHIGTPMHQIIIDPTGEYFELVKRLGGTVADISSKSGNYINTLEIPKNLENPAQFIADQSSLMCSIVEQILGDEYNIYHQSTIDKCIKTLYMDLLSGKTIKNPTWNDLYGYIKMQDQSVEEIRMLCVVLELFTEGTLNIFSHESNVHLDNKLVVIGIRDLPEQLYGVGLLIIMKYIQRIMMNNYHEGIPTMLYVDEEHRLTDREQSATFLEKFVKEGRHWGLKYTGITQNAVDCATTKQGMNILSNSEFVVMLKQSESDKELLSKLFNLPEATLKYVENCPPGTGLMKFGNKIIPVDERIPKKSPLYKMFQTDF